MCLQRQPLNFKIRNTKMEENNFIRRIREHPVRNFPVKIGCHREVSYAKSVSVNVFYTTYSMPAMTFVEFSTKKKNWNNRQTVQSTFHWYWHVIGTWTLSVTFHFHGEVGNGIERMLDYKYRISGNIFRNDKCDLSFGTQKSQTVFCSPPQFNIRDGHEALASQKLIESSSYSLKI